MAIAAQQWQEWQQRLARVLQPQRYTHSISVSEEAVRLAVHYGFSLEKARMAGLLHDVARDLTLEEMLFFASEYEIPIRPEEQMNPIILHAPLGAAILRHQWRIADEEVLLAIALHTVAAPQMSDFCKIIYLADLIEPQRKEWPALAQIRRASYQDLDTAMLLALESSFHYLGQKDTFIHPRAWRAYEFFSAHVYGKESGFAARNT